MIIQIQLCSFYSAGDERRLFEGFKELEAIQNVKGVRRDLLLDVRLGQLNTEAMRELIALLWRYGISLQPLRVFAEKKKFDWLNNTQGYWYKSMFKPKPVQPSQLITPAPH
jgi:hypothetical protein